MINRPQISDDDIKKLGDQLPENMLGPDGKEALEQARQYSQEFQQGKHNPPARVIPRSMFDKIMKMFKR